MDIRAFSEPLVSGRHEECGEVSRLSEVDPHDDSSWRWVLQHYRFDPERRQRRGVIVAAYDNAAEFEEALEASGRRIAAEIDAGHRDRREHMSGVIWHPGYHAEQARGRLVTDAIRHGADPAPLLADGPLPSSMAVFGVDADGEQWSAGGDEPQAPPALRP